MSPPRSASWQLLSLLIYDGKASLLRTLGYLPNDAPLLEAHVSSDFGSREWHESAVTGKAAPRVRRGPGQIELLPSPGTFLYLRNGRGEEACFVTCRASYPRLGSRRKKT